MVAPSAPTRLGLLMRKDEMGLHNSRAEYVRGKLDVRWVLTLRESAFALVVRVQFACDERDIETV